jgi:hypothetical protein
MDGIIASTAWYTRQHQLLKQNTITVSASIWRGPLRATPAAPSLHHSTMSTLLLYRPSAIVTQCETTPATYLATDKT